MSVCASLLGGYSLLPETDYMIGFMNRDGSVKWDKINTIMWEVSRRGAKYMRFFPVWPTEDQEGYKNLLKTYPKNIGMIARLAKEYNITPIITLFNASELRGKRKIYSRWNKSGGFGFSRVNYDEIDDYVMDICENTLRHTYDDVMYEIINEPNPDSYKFMAKVFLLLRTIGVSYNNILPGWDMRLKETDKMYGDAYRSFRELIGGDKQIMGKILKNRMWSTMHKANITNLNEYFTHNLETGQEIPSSHQRNMFYSFDGLMNERPNKREANAFTLHILQTKSKAAQNGRIITECIIGKETHYNPYDALDGMVTAWEDEGFEINRNRWSKPDLPPWIIENESPTVDNPDKPIIPEEPVDTEKPIEPNEPKDTREPEDKKYNKGENMIQNKNYKKITIAIITGLALLSIIWHIQAASNWKWIGIVGTLGSLGFSLLRRISWWWIGASVMLALFFISLYLIAGNWFACSIGFIFTFIAIAINEKIKIRI